MAGESGADDSDGRGGSGRDGSGRGAADGTGPPWDEQMAPDDGETDAAATADGDDDPAGDDSGGEGVAGEFAPDEPVEPGTPDVENAVFVVVGAYLTILAMGEVVVGVGGFDFRQLATISAAALLVTIVCFAFFGLLNPET